MRPKLNLFTLGDANPTFKLNEALQVRSTHSTTEFNAEYKIFALARRNRIGKRSKIIFGEVIASETPIGSTLLDNPMIDLQRIGQSRQRSYKHTCRRQIDRLGENQIQTFH